MNAQNYFDIRILTITERDVSICFSKQFFLERKSNEQYIFRYDDEVMLNKVTIM